MRKAYFIFFLAVLVVGLAVFYCRVFSYDTNIAHPFLTERAVNLCNKNSENKISEQEAKWITQGAIEEDTPIRWMNHFYNPITGNGLTGFSSAKKWSREQTKQKLYSKGNQTWQKAIESYAKGDKKSGFIALGHVLHLIEDMSVPAHTRIDIHIEGDPYEEWVKNNGIKKFEENSIIKLAGLDEFFDLLAGYSNKYFLSKDTIEPENLINKTIVEKIENGVSFKCLEDNIDGRKICLAIYKKSKFGKEEYLLDLSESISVHSDYYSLLAPKTISYGAGVIELFFQEAEKERQKQLEKSWLDKLKEKIGITQPAAPVVAIIQESTYDVDSAQEPELQQENPEITDDSTTVVESGELEEPTYPPAPAPMEQPLTQTRFGSEEMSNNLPQQQPQQQPVESTPEVVVAPKFAISLPYAGFGGGGGAPAPQPAQQEEQTQEENEVPESTYDVDSGVQEDTTPPDVSFSISGCLNIDASSTCLLATATTTLGIFWQSSAEDLDYFEININGIISTTTATSADIAVSDNSKNNFSIRAIDKTGNWSEPVSKNINVILEKMPVIINEVAWMGTQRRDSDEWIELYNRTDYDINFGNNWVLYSQTDLSPFINLSGAIPAKGYFLIERKNTGEKEEATESPIQGIIANLWTSFSYGLKDSGENLVLSYASTTIDEIPYCYNWCGKGVNNNENYRYTMERFNPDISGSDLNNWGTNIGLIKNGKNADGVSINATPKERNSVNYLIAKGAPVSSDITLTKENSPYLVTNHFQIFQASSTLTIEPGVIIKFHGWGMNFYENAKIIAQGTADDPIVFTNFYDDEKPEWDIDGIISTSTPGSWYGVELKTKNQKSVFDNVIFRYGGGYTDGTGSRANLYLENASAKITNSIFEYSKIYGLALVNSNSTVSDNIFRKNNQGRDSAGLAAALVINGGNPIIEKNSFLENFRGIYVSGAGVSIDNSNTFYDNKGEAIYPVNE